VVIDPTVDGKPFAFTVTMPDGKPVRSTTVAPTFQSAIRLNTDTPVFEYTSIDPAELVDKLRPAGSAP
jgi:hypothetical protein